MLVRNQGMEVLLLLQLLHLQPLEILPLLQPAALHHVYCAMACWTK
jgi:hypothetical protein